MLHIGQSGKKAHSLSSVWKAFVLQKGPCRRQSIFISCRAAVLTEVDIQLLCGTHLTSSTAYQSYLSVQATVYFENMHEAFTDKRSICTHMLLE